MSRSSWISDDLMDKVLTAMRPENRLAIEVSLATGLRIDDVLSLKTALVSRTRRPTVVDSKTGKSHRIYLSTHLHARMLEQAGKVWVWPGRLEPLKQHRTRQAVYKDMRQAVEVMRRAEWVSPGQNISPHTARKCAAVKAYQSGGMAAAQALLNHDQGHPTVTLLYALSDKMDYNLSKRRRSRSSVRSKRKDHIGQR